MIAPGGWYHSVKLWRSLRLEESMTEQIFVLVWNRHSVQVWDVYWSMPVEGAPNLFASKQKSSCGVQFNVHSEIVAKSCWISFFSLSTVSSLVLSSSFPLFLRFFKDRPEAELVVSKTGGMGICLNGSLLFANQQRSNELWVFGAHNADCVCWLTGWENQCETQAITNEGRARLANVNDCFSPRV